jgi:hypothetical protein
MVRPLRDIYEKQAQLHEIAAAATSDRIMALRRRAEAVRQLASEKRDEAIAIEKDHEKPRLEHEVGLSEREATIMEREIETLEAERERDLAQAATARRKIGLGP